MKEYKVVVLGSGGVGKSAITVQFVQNTFLEKYDPTIEDFYRKPIDVDDSPVMLEILDTEGTEQFTSMRELYVKSGHGFLLVYSITNRRTLEEVFPMRDQITRIRGVNVPIILVGNKSDLYNERDVTPDDGKSVAAKWQCPFIETSAKTRHNVDEIFAEVVRRIVCSDRPVTKQECCNIL